MRRSVAADRPIVHFGDLGLYRLLFAVRERGEMQEFYDELLGTLAAYDRDRGSRLVATLDAFLRTESATETAVRLNLHRNSLLYRLRRIREITGLDLDDPETRLALHLALRVGDVLRAEET
jgi:purine catabolism regulator